MKKETGVILAGTVGFLTVLGVLGFKQILKRRNLKKGCSMRKMNKNYEKRYKSEDHDGVEFLALL